jgi:hypothetical protein
MDASQRWSLRERLLYWYRPAMAALSLVMLVLAVIESVSLLATAWGQGLVASDLVKGYLAGAQRFLDTGSPYTPEQVAGPWVLDYHSFIHPPSALVLVLPFLVLPLPLWWILPFGITFAALVVMRPQPWTWPLLALCVLWPRSIGSVVAGNTDMWAMAAASAGAAWGWPVTLLAIKPTFLPLGLVAAHRRSAWVAALAAALLCLPAVSLFADWLRVVGNAGLRPDYSLLNLPLVLIGPIAWLGASGTRRGRTPRASTREHAGR